MSDHYVLQNVCNHSVLQYVSLNIFWIQLVTLMDKFRMVGQLPYSKQMSIE